MCGRFFVDAKNREIDRLIESLMPDSGELKLGDIYPTNKALVISLKDGNTQPGVMGWGFPCRDGKGVIFNARSESAMQKPMFRNSLISKPLLVPCNGFYEWQDTSEGKQKYLFTPEEDILYLAGFWNEFKDEKGDYKPAFTILTTQANASVAPVHSRMPVLIGKDERIHWLTGENREDILHRVPQLLHVRPA